MRNWDETASLSNMGSVEDIRCSLKFIDPKDAKTCEMNIAYLEHSLNTERKDRNRATVIKMIEVKLRKLKALPDLFAQKNQEAIRAIVDKFNVPEQRIHEMPSSTYKYPEK